MRTLRIGLMVALAAPAAAQAQQVTAEQAIASQKRQLQAVTGGGERATRGCDPAANPDEIVVCGRDNSAQHRLPLPVEPIPGEPDRLVAGEPPSASAALGAGGCLRLCHQPVQIDVVGAARGAARAIGRLLDPDP